LAEGPSITLDCLTSLERSGRIEQTACAIKSDGIYFTKGQADERDYAVNKFYDSFPKFGPAPVKWKTRAIAQLMRQGRACRLKKSGGSADTPLELDTPPPEADSSPEPEPTVKEEDPHSHLNTEDKQDAGQVIGAQCEQQLLDENAQCVKRKYEAGDGRCYRYDRSSTSTLVGAQSGPHGRDCLPAPGSQSSLAMRPSQSSALTQRWPAGLVPAPRAVPSPDIEDMEILFEQHGKIVGNVRAEYLTRNELVN
jgi:hypothetical protein